MLTKTAPASVDPAQAVSGRLAAPTVAREALERYSWPLPARIAGYFAVIAGLFSILISESWSDAGRIVATLVLGGAFVAAFYLLSCNQSRLGREKLWLLFGMQVVCATVLQQLTSNVRNDMGPLILLFALAAELQFLIRFRYAVLGTAGLWLLAVVTVEVFHAPTWGAVTLQSVLADAGTILSGFIFVAAFTRSAVIELIQRHQATILLDELNAAHAQLQTYVNSVEELTVARERNRMAREIHDTLGHYLTVINVQIETAQKLQARDAARSQEALRTAKRLASDCLAEVRRSVAALRPAALEDVALPEAIGRLADELRRATSITVHVEGHGSGVLPPAVEVTAYRVIQEALTNVRKHAGARNVWLRMEWGATYFSASVRDDGRGAPHQNGAPAHHAGVGLQGMRERVAAVGGTLETTSAPGAGFCVRLWVPTGPDAHRATVDDIHGAEVPAR